MGTKRTIRNKKFQRRYRGRSKGWQKPQAAGTPEHTTTHCCPSAECAHHFNAETNSLYADLECPSCGHSAPEHQFIPII